MIELIYQYRAITLPLNPICEGQNLTTIFKNVYKNVYNCNEFEKKKQKLHI